ncbi:mechanosensitive ion channel family protein [Halarchaeum acidiphilum]|uniref:mechanosensitive ion channel family protein n=1 Tax=Halarchaeum acidiphilum TaxID=489138 RepID=UPI000367DB32|nr:mechanosensitive ion channel family protein [Halarchaeum acidiphilum]
MGPPLGRRSLREKLDLRLIDLLLGLLVLCLAVTEIGTIIYIWGLQSEFVDLVRRFGNPLELGAKGFVSLVIVVVAYIGTGVVKRAIENGAKRRDGISDHEAEIAFRIAQLAIYLAGVLGLLGLWEIDLSGLLIGAGFLGIVLGMAARQTLGAVLAGFVLMFARPFEIGDWVQVGDNEGIVTEISIVNTRIQTFDGEYVMLPNDYVGSEEVVNRSRKGRLRLHVAVGVDYETDVDEAVEVAEETMGELEDVLSVPRPQAVLTEFGDSAVTIDLRFWIDKPSARRKWRAHTAVISAVHAAFAEHDIKIPYPQREVSARPEADGFRVRDAPSPGDGDSDGDERSAAVEGAVSENADETDDNGSESADAGEDEHER